MTNGTLNAVQRTLVIACGELAQKAGEWFGKHMEERQGPSTAVASVNVRATLDDAGRTVLTEALTNISPPNLAVLLKEQGWHLTKPRELALIFVCDVFPGGGEAAAALVSQCTAVCHQHLGVEPTSLHLWLVGDVGEAVVADCLTARLPVSRGTAVLSLRNEAGLRLPDEEVLVQICAELLWCLTATPAQQLPEQIEAQAGDLFIGSQSFFALGVHSWVWSPEATHTSFTRRWLEEVLGQWLAASAEAYGLEEIQVWLQKYQLTTAALGEQLLKAEEKQPPLFAQYHPPTPWELHRQLEKLRFLEAADEESLSFVERQACLRLEKPMLKATAVLQAQAKMMLNQNPVRAIDRVSSWLTAVRESCEEAIDQTLTAQDVINDSGHQLATQRGVIEGRLKMWLAVYPGDNWAAWMKLALRPWRWPKLAWCYWHIRQSSQQLAYLLAQQAVLKRQRIQNQVARKGLAELEQIVRRVLSQVEEIGEMLNALAGEFVAGGAYTSEAVETHTGFHTQLPVPARLYSQLVVDEAAEAVTAAVAVGGLGQQIPHLDETILEKLWRFGQERLAAVWELTTVDALAAHTNDHDLLQETLIPAWAAACPLWSLDEAAQTEAMRQQRGQLALVCGADAPLLANLLPAEEAIMIPFEASEHQRLWLIRARYGLTVNTAVPPPSQV